MGKWKQKVDEYLFWLELPAIFILSLWFFGKIEIKNDEVRNCFKKKEKEKENEKFCECENCKDLNLCCYLLQQ